MTFDSAVARISCAQICRSNGIDRCSHAALESLSDVMTRFLEVLATTAMQAAQVKANDSCDLEDAVFALENLHIIPRHLDGADSEGLSDLITWLRGPAAQRALQVSKIQQQTLSALGQAQGAAIAAQHGANEMQGSTAKLDIHADWLRQMVNKQVLMGHGHKYKSTVFGDGLEPSIVASGTEFMDPELARRLGVAPPDTPQGGDDVVEGVQKDTKSGAQLVGADLQGNSNAAQEAAPDADADADVSMT